MSSILTETSAYSNKHKTQICDKTLWFLQKLTSLDLLLIQLPIYQGFLSHVYKCMRCYLFVCFVHLYAYSRWFFMLIQFAIYQEFLIHVYKCMLWQLIKYILLSELLFLKAIFLSEMRCCLFVCFVHFYTYICTNNSYFTKLRISVFFSNTCTVCTKKRLMSHIIVQNHEEYA